MFAFFGSYNPHGRHSANVGDWLSTEAAEMTRHHSELSNLFLATLGEDGSVLGHAQTQGVQLLYLGAVCRPFPHGLQGSPLDDPQGTAQALLKAYQQQDLGFLDGVVGRYAVIVTDANRERVLLARDPYDGPRIFYRQQSDTLSFATRLVDMVRLLGSEAALDRSLEDFLLGFEFLPDDHTFISDVKVLEKGCLLCFQRGRIEITTVAKMHVDPALTEAASSAEEEEITDALYQAFTLSLQDELPSEGTIGVLQGGFDSMLISAMLVKMGRTVETFTFRYREDGYTQHRVEEFSTETGVRHNWVDIKPGVIKQGLRCFSDEFNQPVGQAHYLIASSQAARAIRERGIRHCLTGDGCDGLFLGYPTVYARARLIQRLSFLRGLISPALRFAGSSRWLEMCLGHPYRFVRNIGNVLSRPMPTRGHIAACTLDRTALHFLRKEQPPQKCDPETVLQKLAEGLEDAEPLRLAYLGKGRVGLNAAKLEGITQSSGIAFLSPYMHPRMAAVAGCIDDTFNRPGEGGDINGKYVFAKTVDKYGMLASRFVHQAKMSPVTSPVDLWYWSELQTEMLDRFKQLPFATDDAYLTSLVAPKGSEKWFRKHIGISRHVTQAAGLLATYASFASQLQHGQVEDE
ncbi:MAG: hypothetical protein GY949_23140 [Gammaproteobacteria bacterium]|nr:hypothetical protein [Gammaproteobacteria bacterium]